MLRLTREEKKKKLFLRHNVPDGIKYFLNLVFGELVRLSLTQSSLKQTVKGFDGGNTVLCWIFHISHVVGWTTGALAYVNAQISVTLGDRQPVNTSDLGERFEGISFY